METNVASRMIAVLEKILRTGSRFGACDGEPRRAVENACERFVIDGTPTTITVNVLELYSQEPGVEEFAATIKRKFDAMCSAIDKATFS